MLTSALSASILRRGNISTGAFSSADLYAFMDEEIESKLIPLILKNLEEYYVADLAYNVTAGQGSYGIPTRSIAGKLRDVQILSATDPSSIRPLPRLDVTSLSMGRYGNKSGFYLKGNSVIVYPTPTSTQGILNLEYYMRPNSCVDPGTCAVITAIAGSVVTVSSLPTNITTSTPVDFVKVKPGFECPAIDQTITIAAGNVLTMAVAPPSTLSVGDYVCQATQSCILQVPQELLPLLSQYVVVRVMSAQSDLQAYQQAVAELTKLEENAQLLIAPRVDGKPKRVTNSRSMLRFV